MRLIFVVFGVVYLAISLTGCERNSSEPVRIVHAVLSESDPSADALEQLLKWANSGEDIDVDAVVLVANLDRPAIASSLAKALDGAPAGLPIYLAPGARLLEAQETPQVALGTFRAAVAKLKMELSAQNPAIRLTDLSGCYSPPLEGGQCSAKLPGRKVRLVGYPGYWSSAKPLTQDVLNQQKDWTEAFRRAMQGGALDDVTVLVTPVALPLDLGFWGTAPVREDWMQAARGAQMVLGVLGDAALRRAAYETNAVPPEAGLGGTWALSPSFGAPGAGIGRPADGVSVVSATEGTVTRELFWYSPQGSAFRKQYATAEPSPAGGPWIFTPRWLWGLGKGLDDLPKAAVLSIAFLAAFLTAVAVWQIPTPSSSSLTPGGNGNTAASQATPPPPAKAPSLLEQNFARTVISGLSGLAVASLALETIGQQDKSAIQQFYVVWFIFCFFVLLVSSSLLKSFGEALRVAVYIRSTTSHSAGRAVRERWFWLTASDVFWNLIQGKNELKSLLWADELRNAQDNNLDAIDKIVVTLRGAIVDFLNNKDSAVPPPPAGRAAAGEVTADQAAADQAAADQAAADQAAADQAAADEAAGDPAAAAQAAPGQAAADQAAADQAAADQAAADQAAADQAAAEQAAAEQAAAAERAAAEQAAADEAAIRAQGAGTASGQTTEGSGARALTRLDDVRVAVSVLSDDEQRLYYVSRLSGSSSKDFNKVSVAFAAAVLPEPRWWSISDDKRPVVLFDNTSGTIRLLEGVKRMLKDSFTNRRGDYGSFIVIPIPMRPNDDARRAALHISFRREGDVRGIWTAMVDNAGDEFKTASQLLESTPEPLQSLLRLSMDVIERLLRNFNEQLFDPARRRL